MNKHKLAALLHAAALCLALCACGVTEDTTRDTVSLWYTEGDPAARELSGLIQEYNDSIDGGKLLKVSMRAFPDEESLAASFESARPDLLLCSQTRAFDLSERGMLRDISPALSADAPVYPEYLLDRFDGTGRGFFPLGSQVQLLYLRQGSAGEGALSDMDSLLSFAAEYGRENRAPFLTADSFADLFYESMFSRGSEFHAQRELDLFNENYKYIYNLFADAAYGGGLVSLDYKAAELVQSGYLPCAVVRSGSLPGMQQDGFEILPMPLLENGSSLLAESCAIAVTVREGRSAVSTEAFMCWLLSSERLCSLALRCGLVPAAESEGSYDGGKLSAALMDIYSDYELHLPDLNSDYLKNRASFERSFRAALELLN